MNREEARFDMLAWSVLLFLVIAEVAAIVWWLRKEHYPVFFSGWAALFYTALLAVDFVVAWIVSLLSTPGGSGTLMLLMIVGILAILVVALLTYFFRWAVRTDITDIPGK
jgi:hypothetical protein